MQLTSKAQAMRIYTQLQAEGKPVKLSKFCSGKYEWKGRADYYLGREVVNLAGVHAVWVEQRKDKDGFYAQLRSVS